MTENRWQGKTPEFKVFTLEEANELLPTVRPLLIDLKSTKQRLDEARVELESFAPAMKSNGHRGAAIALEAEIAALLSRLSSGIEQFINLGIEIKDVNSGLIDFPSLREGRIVYLCWRLDEDKIEFWHEVDAGFAGREPI